MIQPSPYLLLYTFVERSIPKQSEVVQVASVTARYINHYLQTQFPDAVEFQSKLFNSTFQLGQDYEMLYASRGIFTASSPHLPSNATLQAAIAKAFEPPAVQLYLHELKSLPNNVFGTSCSPRGASW